MSEGAGVLLVTGASKGIGAAVAIGGAARGYAVAVNYATDEAGANAVVEQIQRVGGRAAAFGGDVASEADVLQMFAGAGKLGNLVALVNNAGITGGLSRFEDLGLARFERTMAVNVTGSVLCAREAVRRMSTKHGGTGGAIVNVSSRAAELGGSGEWVHYAISKRAVEAMTVGLAREVATEGIRVNAVAPGLVDTGIHATSGVPDRVNEMAPMIPMKRGGTAGEIAEAILWLLSPEASYVTGAILPVGGGR